MTRLAATIVADARWDAFHAASPNATIFGSSRWLRAAARVFGGHAAFLVAHDEAAGDAPRCGTPLLLRHRGPFTLAAALPITLYGGMYSSAAADDAHGLDVLLATIERKTFFATLPLPIGSAAGRIAEARGWERIPQQTIRIPLDDIDATWRGYSQSLRRKIRRADDAGLHCEVSDDLSIILAMHEESYARHGMKPPVATDRLAVWLAALHAEGMITQYVARDADQRARAARVVICDGPVVYDWMAGLGAGAAHTAASHWLVHDIMRRHAARGCTVFDFMGANTPGVSDFKFLFGGEVVPYDVVRFRRSRAVRWLEQLKDGITLRRRGA